MRRDVIGIAISGTGKTLSYDVSAVPAKTAVRPKNRLARLYLRSIRLASYCIDLWLSRASVQVRR